MANAHDQSPLKAPIGLPSTHPYFMHNTSHTCLGQVGTVISMGMNDPDVRRWNKSAAQCFADRWVRPQRGLSKGRETTQEGSSKNETLRI
jgi:hypothetical protein